MAHLTLERIKALRALMLEQEERLAESKAKWQEAKGAVQSREEELAETIDGDLGMPAVTKAYRAMKRAEEKLANADRERKSQIDRVQKSGQAIYELLDADLSGESLFDHAALEKSGGDAVAQLRISDLTADKEAIEALESFGVHTVGEYREFGARGGIGDMVAEGMIEQATVAAINEKLNRIELVGSSVREACEKTERDAIKSGREAPASPSEPKRGRGRPKKGATVDDDAPAIFPISAAR